MMRCTKVPWLEMSLGWTCERWGNKEIKCKGRVGTDYGGPRKPGRMFRLDITHGRLGATSAFLKGNCVILPAKQRLTHPGRS